MRRTAGAEVVCRDGRIVFVGSPEERRRQLGELPDAERLDGRRGTLIPGFVDPHTHLPWAGSREEEFAARLAGKTYQEIAAAGGGILSTVAATRRASEEELVANVLRRMDQMLAWGTTTAEAKSGYGLNKEDELKQLRAIRQASGRHPVDLVPTLLAAHEVPPEYRAGRPGPARWVDQICEEIVPGHGRGRARPLLRRLLRGGGVLRRGVAPGARGRRPPWPRPPPPRRRVRRLRRRRARRRAGRASRPTT